MRLERERGASVSAAAWSSLLRQLHAAARRDDEDGLQDATETRSAADAAGGLHACRTNEPDTIGSGTGASRSGHRSPDDVMGSPGHPAQVLCTSHLQTQTKKTVLNHRVNSTASSVCLAAIPISRFLEFQRRETLYCRHC